MSQEVQLDAHNHVAGTDSDSTDGFEGLSGNENFRADDCLIDDHALIVQCEKCIHHKVCKYTDNKPSVPVVPEPFHVSLMCDYYRDDPDAEEFNN